MRFFALLAALLVICAPADARWHRAESPNFIVYMDGSQSEIRDQAITLERYSHLVRIVMGADPNARTAKLRVFVVRSYREVNDFVQGGSSNLAGFYRAVSRGPYAVVPERSVGRGDFATSGEEILFHEYAHHLMRQYFQGNYPAWYDEGFAEFLSTARLEGNGRVEIGHPPTGRVPFLRYGRWIPFRELLTEQPSDAGMLYAQGWLVTHWAFSDAANEALLRDYLRAIRDGATLEEAYESSFGAEDRNFNRELERYMQRDIRAMGFSMPPPTDVPVSVTAISDTDAEVALLYARHGEDGLREAQEIVDRNPDHPGALTELARLRLENGDAEGALEAGRAAQALAADRAEPRLFSAMALLRLARESQDARDPRWREARELLVEANQLGPGNPLILFYFYRAYPTHNAITDNAREALASAFFLLPQSREIRMTYGAELVRQDRFDEAERTLAPLGQSAHGEANNGPMAAELARLREQIQTGRGLTGSSSERIEISEDPAVAE